MPVQGADLLEDRDAQLYCVSLLPFGKVCLQRRPREQCSLKLRAVGALHAVSHEVALRIAQQFPGPADTGAAHRLCYHAFELLSAPHRELVLVVDLGNRSVLKIVDASLAAGCDPSAEAIHLCAEHSHPARRHLRHRDPLSVLRKQRCRRAKVAVPA